MAKKGENIDIETTRQTFVIGTMQLKKLRIISVHEEKQQKEILHDALQDYIDKYEKKNGEIKIIMNILDLNNYKTLIIKSNY